MTTGRYKSPHRSNAIRVNLCLRWVNFGLISVCDSEVWLWIISHNNQCSYRTILGSNAIYMSKTLPQQTPPQKHQKHHHKNTKNTTPKTPKRTITKTPKKAIAALFSTMACKLATEFLSLYKELSTCEDLKKSICRYKQASNYAESVKPRQWLNQWHHYYHHLVVRLGCHMRFPCSIMSHHVPSTVLWPFDNFFPFVFGPGMDTSKT